MTKHSIVLLISSIILFITGIVFTIFTIAILDINIVEALKSYKTLKFFLVLVLIMIIAFYITISIRAYRNHMKQKKVREQFDIVRLDNLTQIYNFDYFINLLETIEVPFSLVMLDIDNFKEINEKFDSVIGDLVLKVIAKTIKDHIRINDIVARYQGDAFLIILQNSSPQNAIGLMKVISNNIMENDRLSEKNIKLLTSVGIHFVTQKESSESLFRKTVEALCIAKTEGEDNKVVLYKKLGLNEKKVR